MASNLSDHPNPAMRDHLASGHVREGFLGSERAQNKVVEKTAAEAALEIASRFPLSHNPCCWYHLVTRDNALHRSSDAGKDSTPKRSAEPPRQGELTWPDFG